MPSRWSWPVKHRVFISFSYFSPASLASLFRHAGFELIDLARDYDDQYLMVEARPGSGAGQALPGPEDDLRALSGVVQRFAAEYPQRLAWWKNYLREIKRGGRRAVLWGAGSKGVAFLTTLGVQDEIEYAVDINPHKHGTFMAGTGQEIVAPEFLRQYQPDVVIVMNPIYRQEVQRSLQAMELNAEMMTV